MPYNPYTQPYTTTTATSLDKVKFMPAKGQPDSWTLRLPDATGDGHHRWDYTHVHASRTCDCHSCVLSREEEREEREREEKEREDRERELDIELERERERERQRTLEWHERELQWELERERKKELSRLAHARRNQRRLGYYRS